MGSSSAQGAVLEDDTLITNTSGAVLPVLRFKLATFQLPRCKHFNRYAPDYASCRVAHIHTEVHLGKSFCLRTVFSVLVPNRQAFSNPRFAHMLTFHFAIVCYRRLSPCIFTAQAWNHFKILAFGLFDARLLSSTPEGQSWYPVTVERVLSALTQLNRVLPQNVVFQSRLQAIDAELNENPDSIYPTNQNPYCCCSLLYIHSFWSGVHSYIIHFKWCHGSLYHC